ncbi:MAG: putative sulfate exporter family transporter [Chitinophagales bacterium]|nr:putative sulfate exporter family transporter [Chitinophagales bacterium]
MNIAIENKNLQKVIFISLAILCVTPLITSPIALGLGFFVAFFVGNPFGDKPHQYIHTLLKISIIGLGFGLKLNEALQAGKTGFLMTIVSIFSVIIVGFIVGKLFKIDKPLSYLISVGTAICGGSAIAAVSPIIKAKANQISIALAIIFTLNSIALFIYPSIGHWFHLSQEQFGLWCAIGIHDTSSVVGAASKYGDDALKVATTVKLARALWIIPVSLLTMLFFKSQDSKVKIPWFIGLFIIAILLNTYIPALDIISRPVISISKAGLNLTLFLIGTTLTMTTLKTISWKPLVLALILWFSVSIGSLSYLYNL